MSAGRPGGRQRGVGRGRGARGARGRQRGRRVRGRTGVTGRARRQLGSFRKATILAVALTAFLLMFTGEDPGTAQEGDTTRLVLPDTVSVIQEVPLEELQQPAEDTGRARPDSLSRESTREATQALRDIWYSLFELLPKLGIALGIFLLAALFVRLLRPLLRRTLKEWERADAFTAITGIVIWLLAIGIAFTVLAGDMRALLGSLGLIGLALSWALQTPIESFTGWLLNSLKGYYRVGDRIAVGEVHGDVFRIDLLTTTVWEYGGADRPPGSVRAEQPTGRVITFPNNEVLTGSVVNYTRDFPFVWDEISVGIAQESDSVFAMETLSRAAKSALGEYMREPARMYRSILTGTGLESAVADEPQVFLSMNENGLDVTIRYLVGARERRLRKSELTLEVARALESPEARGRILPLYPRRQVQIVGPDGAPREGAGPYPDAGSP